MDEDNEVEEEDDDALQIDPTEKLAISSSKIWQFIIPEINFEATAYPELIDWETAKLTEPPLTHPLTNEEIMAVERAVRLAAEASSSVVEQEARDGFIRQRIQSRKDLKSHATKQDFFPKIEASKRSCRAF